MPPVNATKSDVIWNYIGTIVSMASGFVLLPFLVRFLSDDELGLWYVFTAIGNLAMLFEFGFNPTFARNIVYVVSGAKQLSAQGRSGTTTDADIDWHLLNTVIRTTKVLFASIALVVGLLLATGGSAYIRFIAGSMDAHSVWVSWAIFCLAVFLNLFFLYSITILRGFGDIAGENQAKTLARSAQVVVSAVLLAMGYGLMGAAIGYLTNAVLMRAYAMARMHKHRELEAGRRSDASPVTLVEITSSFKTVGHIAWRDGIVQLALYASTQASSIMASLFLGLAETGTYSVLLQLATAVCNFACAYPKTFFPAMQASFAEGDTERQTAISSQGVVAYWVMFGVGTLGVLFVILPLLPLFKPGISLSYPLFVGMCVYLGLLNQHSIFCNYIISMNEIPYMAGYLAASLLGIALVALFSGLLSMGALGIVLGQALSQLVYNNWKWPQYYCGKLGIAFPALLRTGVTSWKMRLKELRTRG